jgi:hypothetical protein
MSENNTPKQTRGVTLREPKDVRRVCQRIVSKAFQQGEELQYSGRISQLMVADEGWELDKLADIERRLEALERAQDKKLSQDSPSLKSRSWQLSFQGGMAREA